MSKIIVKVKNGIEWTTIELDLEQLENYGEYETTDNLGWKVKAELRR